MRSLGRYRILVICAFLVLGVALAFQSQEPPSTPQPSAEMRQEAVQYRGSSVPPKTLQQTADGHWTPYASPGEAPEDAEVYIIQRGDTLSAIAQSKLGNLYLWPQIWDQNEYIKDAHWIYPGDPLWISKSMVISEEVPVEEAAQGPKVPEIIIEPEAAAPPVHLHDLECTGFVSATFARPHLQIVSAPDRTRESMSDGYMVYLNEGAKDGRQVGETFYVLRVGQVVHHPETGKAIGTLSERIGQVKLLAVQDSTSIAQIIQSCDEITYGDPLVPFEALSIPWDIKAAAELPLTLPASEKVRGCVIWSEDRLGSFAHYYIGYIDMGANQRLVPGDKLWVYRHATGEDTIQAGATDLFRQSKVDYAVKDLFRPPKPEKASGKAAAKEPEREQYPPQTEPQDVTEIRKYIGEAVVLTTQANTACVKFIVSSEEIHLGDSVQLE